MSRQPFREPYSLSVAPPPRLTEGHLLQIDTVVRGRPFTSLEEVETFLRSSEGEAAMREATPRNPVEQAYKLALDAWEMDPPDRYTWAERAREMDPRCADAYLILAEQEPAWRKRRRLFEEATRQAE